MVPLFQRPYVWNEENQWDPLWNDVVRLADRVLSRPGDKHHPHFLGAVVLQQFQKQTGQMQERTIIDGQQRLTTLQLLMDALHAELLAVGADTDAMEEVIDTFAEYRQMFANARTWPAASHVSSTLVAPTRTAAWSPGWRGSSAARPTSWGSTTSFPAPR